MSSRSDPVPHSVSMKSSEIAVCSFDGAQALDTLINPLLEPFFRSQNRAGAISAWHGHVPFAHWLVAAVRPRMIVELGTHYGVSYSAFCESVIRSHIDSRCFAIDTWTGDNHSGAYDETVYNEFRKFHDSRYAAFSEIVRTSFDDALHYMPDFSIDLLHIDGFHSYEAVRHDFESWKPKLSSRSVVLFHDTNVLQREFGVAKFWAEIKDQYPSFEFLHGHGLGVLCVGPETPRAAKVLSAEKGEALVTSIRDRFSVLGRLHMLTYDVQRTLDRHKAVESEWQIERRMLHDQVEKKDSVNRKLLNELLETKALISKIM
jgi:hypothetical protein